MDFCDDEWSDRNGSVPCVTIAHALAQRNARIHTTRSTRPGQQRNGAPQPLRPACSFDCDRSRVARSSPSRVEWPVCCEERGEPRREDFCPSTCCGTRREEAAGSADSSQSSPVSDDSCSLVVRRRSDSAARAGIATAAAQQIVSTISSHRERDFSFRRVMTVSPGRKLFFDALV